MTVMLWGLSMRGIVGANRPPLPPQWHDPFPGDHPMQHAQIFVNLPITDMARSQAFYTALGYRFNPDFTNEQGACLVLGENLFAMLLVKPFFQGFTSRTIADAHQSAQVLVALPCADRAAVDALVQGATAAGGKAHRPPQDLGFMYSQAFEDPDGHIWEPFWMDPKAQPAQG